MLEIAIVYFLSKSIGDAAQAKGRARFGYQFLLWVFWFGGEIFGAVVGGMMSAAGGGDEPNMLLVYGAALAGAIVGAVVAFAIVNGLPAVKADDGFYRGPSDYDRRLADRRGEREAGGTWQPSYSEKDDRIQR